MGNLVVEKLDVGYGDIPVLWDVSLNVDEGEIVTLVGSNGAGKTTLINTISGLLLPSSGQIIYGETEISYLPCRQRILSGIAQVPEGRKLLPAMSVQENLTFGSLLRSRQEANESLRYVYDLFPELEKRKSQLAGTLSGGEQQMCAIGRALMADPKLLLIDELSLGLAPVIVDRLVGAIKSIREASPEVSILLVEQDVFLAFSVADRGYILETGKIVNRGDAKELLRSDTVREAYLGI